jgi:hypothetical protein
MVKASTPVQKPQQFHDPRVLGDARLVQDRVITLKWLRMVPPPPPLPSLISVSEQFFYFCAQVGVPLPLSTAAKPAVVHDNSSVDPIQASLNIHELFHDG